MYNTLKSCKRCVKIVDINKLLEGVECSCGRTHKCDIKSVYIENGAVSRLSELCRDYNNILVVADENTYNAAGEKVDDALSDKCVTKVIFSGKKVLIPDEKAIESVTKQIDDKDLIVGVGSGVIQDLCKCVSLYEKIPYMIVATAPSMDGYASTGAAMILEGMKETVPAGLPLAIVADTEVLKNAPMEMIKSGYGDIIGKYSALCDWKLSHAVNDEYLCDYIYDTTYKMIDETIKTAKGLLLRDEQSVKTLMEALIVVGIMMSFAGSSRPASGSEHHLSHFFEIVGIVKNEPYFAHGIDVAYSAVVTADIRKKLLDAEYPEKQFVPERREYVAKMKDVYFRVADGCIALQDKGGNYKKDRLSVNKAKKDEIRSILENTPSAQEISDILKLCDLDISEYYNLYGKEKIDTAVLYAKDLKDRYSVLWMNYDLMK